MKVAIAIRQISSNTGASRNTQEQVRFFRSQGATVDIFAESFNREKFEGLGASVHRVTFWPFTGNRGRRFFQRRSEKWIKGGGYDLVIGHGDIIQQDVLFLHNSVHKASEMIKGRALPEDSILGNVHAEILKSQKFKILAANSKLMMDDAQHRFGVPPEKLRVIYPAYRTEVFSPQIAQTLRAGARKDLGIADSDILFGLITSGNFEKRNVDLLLRAASQVVSKEKRVKLLIVGKQDEPGLYQKLAQDLGLASHVIFRPTSDHPEEYFAALDVSVLPAKWEEFGRVVLEAMGSGLPVIVSEHVGSSELLEGASREFVLPLDETVFAQSMQRLVAEPELRKRLSMINASTAMNFSEEAQQRKMQDLLMEVMS